MDSVTFPNEDTYDLSSCTVEDSCLWLLSKLRVNEHEDNAYTLPFSSYVITWYKAIPLKCIIMAQNPYPQNVYPPIAAAMSYTTELAELQMKRGIYKSPVPPTVEVFANDMYVHANINKEDSINILKNGWSLIEKGILLVNEGVFTKSNDPEYYDESSDQCNVIIRMLQETEKHGSRTVDVYGLGEAGQRMASNLCSWYKSNTVRLSKHTATHPAAVARRFNNLDHPDCHMATPSFSKSLAKYFSNNVAYAYTMAKKSEADIKLQRIADTLRSAYPTLNDYTNAIENFNSIVEIGKDMEYNDAEATRDMFKKLHDSGDILTFRSRAAASALLNVQRVTDGVSGYVSKPGPSMQNPTSSSLSEHVGSDNRVAKPLTPMKGKISLTKSKNSIPRTDTSSFSRVSPAPSVVSVESSSVPNKVKLTKSKSTNSTPVKLTKSELPTSSSKSITNSSISNLVNSSIDDTVSDIGSNNTETVERPVISSMSARFRKKDIIANSTKSDSSGQQKKESKSGGPLSITKEERDQLSSVEAVVQSNKDDAENDPECAENFELIQNDISAMVKYNSIVQRLVDAINEDKAINPSFNFVEWALDNTKPSTTYDLCREIFDF